MNNYNDAVEIDRLLQFQKEEFPELYDAVKNESIILFLGAGVSKLYGLPLWNELADKMIKKLKEINLISYAQEKILSGETASDPRKVITICYRICKKENLQVYTDAISKCFDFDFDSKYKNNFLKVYDKIFSIKARAYLTTNIDLGITCYKDDFLKMSRIKTYNCTLPKDKESIKQTGYNIIKDGNIVYLHGNVENDDTINECIMPLDKYLSFYGEGDEFVRGLFSNLSGCIIIFIGYSLNEWDVIEKIYKISKQRGENESIELTGYILSPIFSFELAKFNLEKVYYETFGIKAIPYIIDDEGYEKLFLVLGNLTQEISKDRPVVFDTISDINNIESKNPNEKELKDFLNKIQRRTIYEDEFFRKISKLGWFDELKNRDYFKANLDTAPKKTKENQYYVPFWNVLPYLENVSAYSGQAGNEEYTDKLLLIIKEVTNYHVEHNRCLDNCFTWQSFVKILVNISNDKISEGIIDLISIWLDTKFNNTLVPIEILKNLLPKFLDSDDPEDLKKAEKIVDITTGIKQVYYTEQEKQKITIVDGYILNENFLVQKKAIKVGEKCSGQIIYTLADRIKQIIESEYADNYDLSYIWLKSLFENPKYYYLPAKTIITLILRDIIIAKAKKDKEATKDILHEFLQKYKRPLFKRLALLVIGTEWDTYSDIFWEIIDRDKNGDLFNGQHYKPEMYMLLQRNVGKFSNGQKERIKNIIEFLEEKAKERYIDYQKQEWYSAVKSDDYFKTFYEECRKITGVEEEISFKQPETRYGFGESPETEEGIMKKSNEELAQYLTTFKTVDFRKGPTVRGLAEAMKNTTASRPEKFTDYLAPFLKTGYLYISNILWGIAQAIKNKKEINWDSLFIFIIQYIKPDDYWEDKYKINDSGDILGVEEDHLSVIIAVSNVIKESTRYELYTFSEKYFTDAQEILFFILDKLLPQKNKIDDNSYHDDFLMNAENSLFGTITEALANLLSKVVQIVKNTSNEQTVELGKKLINKYEEILKEEITEGYFWLGAYLVDFYYTDKEWTENQINGIDMEQPFWKPFMSGYLLLSRSVDDDLYKLMHKNYLKSIDCDFKAKKAKEMLARHICTQYLKGIEEINNGGGLFKKLLDTWDRFLIGEIIRFFWIQRDYLIETLQNQNKDINTARKKIIDFWRWVYENKYKGKEKNKLNQADKEILSELSKLTLFLSEIGSENCKWLELSAQHITNIDISFFIEYLNGIKDKENSVDYLGDIFLKILEESTPTFRQEDIVLIVEFLYVKNKKTEADKICNIYAERGYNFLKDMYVKYN